MKSAFFISLVILGAASLSACRGGAPQHGQTGEALPAPIPEPEEPLATRAELLSLCKSESSLAEGIMDSRQHGIPMASAMELAESPELEELRAITRNLVVGAYDTPRFSTPEISSRAIRDFSDDAYLACLRRRGLAP